METNSNDTKYFKAKQRVAEIKKFYSSLMFYVIFIGALAGLNYYLNAWSHPWFLWAAIGWLIGIFLHGMKVFKAPFFGKDWEERKMKQFMEEEESKNQNKNRWN